MMFRLTRYNPIAVPIVLAASAGLAAILGGSTEAAAIDDNVEAIPADSRVIPASQAASGNPLRTIPLNNLSVTRDRPIFSPSRRPLAPAVATAPDTPLQPERPVRPERPQLSLVGAISNGKEGFGIFLDRVVDTVLKLKTGEQHKGWILREVHRREAVMENGEKTTTLSLPALSSAPSGRSEEDETNSKRSNR